MFTASRDFDPGEDVGARTTAEAGATLPNPKDLLPDHTHSGASSTHSRR